MRTFLNIQLVVIASVFSLGCGATKSVVAPVSAKAVSPETSQSVDAEKTNPEQNPTPSDAKSIQNVQVGGVAPKILARIFFELDSEKMLPQSLDTASQMYDLLEERKADIELIEIVGTADSSESNPKVLAQRRSDAVKSFLVTKGIDPNRLQTSIGLPEVGVVPEGNYFVSFKLVKWVDTRDCSTKVCI